MSRFRRSVWKRVVFGGLLLVAVYFLVRFTGLRQFTSIQNLIQLVEQARLNGAIIAMFYVGFAFGVMVLPITIFPIVGGVLLEFWIALPLNLAATTTGAFLSFCLSRYFGRAAVEILLRGKLKTINQYATQKGVRTVVLLRLIGIPPFLITNYALGFSSMRKRHFIIGTFIGIFPWMVLVTYLSNHLWQGIVTGGQQGILHSLIHHFRPLLLVSLMALIVAGATFWLRRRQKTPA